MVYLPERKLVMADFENIKARSRYFRILLYTDNPVHCKAFDIIKNGYSEEYLGIVHKASDGGEKEHIHIHGFPDGASGKESTCHNRRPK